MSVDKDLLTRKKKGEADVNTITQDVATLSKRTVKLTDIECPVDVTIIHDIFHTNYAGMFFHDASMRR
jgi:hypothetical protein